MRFFQTGRLGFILVVVVVSSWGCQSMPKGDWHLETGRAYTVDDLGERRLRSEASKDAQRDAHLKILRHVKAMPLDNNLVGDYMQQNVVVGALLRSLILAAREFERQYSEDGTLRVTMGVDLDEVRRIVRENPL